MGIEFWCLSIFRKKSLNWNNPWWSYSPKQLIYFRIFVNIWNSRNKFRKIKKITLKKVTALGSLFVMYSYFFHGIPFIGSRFYWLSFVKSMCTKSAANNYLFKVNNKSTRTRCELCSKLTTKTTGRSHFSRSDVFIFNFEHVSCFYCWFCLLGGVRLFRDAI